METFSALLALCVGNSPVPGDYPAQRPVTRSFDVFFDPRLNKRLIKQSWSWWFETLPRPLWRHSNVTKTLSINILAALFRLWRCGVSGLGVWCSWKRQGMWRKEYAHLRYYRRTLPGPRSYCGRWDSWHLRFRVASQIRMIMSSNGNTFRVTGPLRGEFTGHRCNPHTKASDAELWYSLWSAPE